MPKQRTYTWFIADPCSVTQKYILSVSAWTETETSMDRVCADGKSHNLLQISSETRNYLVQQKPIDKLRFKVFCQEGSGKIREVPNWRLKQLAGATQFSGNAARLIKKQLARRAQPEFPNLGA